MKRFIGIFILIMIILAGCVARKIDNKKEVFFLIRGTPEEINLWQKAVDLFMKENEDVKVRLEFVPYSEYWSKIETMMAGGTSPDVIFLESTRMASFIRLKALQPLDEYVEKDKGFNKNDFYPQAINACLYNDKLYGIPNDMAIYALYYNQDLFQQAGVPYPPKDWNWMDFLSAAKKLTIDKNKDGTPETYGFNIGWTYYLWIWQNGGDFYDNPKNPKKAVFNSKETKEALLFLKDLMHKYKVAPTFAQASSFGSSAEMFMTGRVAMIIEGHWMVPQFKQIKSFTWDVAKTSAAELPKKRVKANYNAGSCFSIPRLSENKENAWKLIKFLSGDKGQEILISAGFSTPALRTEKITDLFLKSSPPKNNGMFLDMINVAHLPPVIPKYNEMSDMLYRELDYIWLDKKPIDEVMKSIEKELNKFIE
ncbi:MAG: sugar ABC transporter substrate-binding protein [Spirochaetes bacterium]|nr:sugar ABC transporter substrate-binding protein [Spirochaetota bacterium]